MQPAPLRLILLGLALLGGSPTPVQADEAVVTFDLSQARVRASPGWPAALEGFLPPGRAIEPLTDEGVQGPQLILGLWDSDPQARHVGVYALGMDRAHGPRGGYVAALSLYKGHPVGVLLAQDAAALAAARFELETFAPGDVAMTERRVDVTQPDAQGGVRMALGRRDVVPAFRLRALGGLGPDEGPLDVAAAHANRLWLDPRPPEGPGGSRTPSLLAEHGIERVAVAKVGVGDGVHTVEIEGLLAWQRRGVRHFVLDVQLARARAVRDAAEEARREQHLIEDVAARLAVGAVSELLVIPIGRSDEEAARHPPPDLSRIPGALLGWTGPTPRPLAVTLEQARRKAAGAGVPVVFVETWMEAARNVPSAPRGRDPRLGEVLAGIVVLPGPGATEVLANLWQAGATNVEHDVSDLFATYPTYDPAAGVAAFLDGAIAALEAAREERGSDSAWLRRLQGRARADRAALPPPSATVVARMTRERLATDGRLDEPAWRDAPVTALGPGQVRALSDGRRVVIGVSAPGGLAQEARIELTLHGGRGLPRTRHLALAPRGCRGAPRPDAFEVAFEHYDLGGDPYPGGSCGLNVALTTRHGAWRLADPTGPAEVSLPGGSLVVVR